MWKAGRFTASGWQNRQAGMTKIRSAIWAVCETSFSAPCDWSLTLVFTQSAGPANRRLRTYTTGMGEKEVKSEIERYIVAPGQACAYKIGMLKIQELRARAEKELGERFDQREFHDVVLKNGGLPLEILEEQVNSYIQRKKYR